MFYDRAPFIIDLYIEWILKKFLPERMTCQLLEITVFCLSVRFTISVYDRLFHGWLSLGLAERFTPKKPSFLSLALALESREFLFYFFKRDLCLSSSSSRKYCKSTYRTLARGQGEAGSQTPPCMKTEVLALWERREKTQRARSKTDDSHLISRKSFSFRKESSEFPCPPEQNKTNQSMFF